MICAFQRKEQKLISIGRTLCTQSRLSIQTKITLHSINFKTEKKLFHFYSMPCYVAIVRQSSLHSLCLLLLRFTASESSSTDETMCYRQPFHKHERNKCTLGQSNRTQRKKIGKSGQANRKRRHAWEWRKKDCAYELLNSMDSHLWKVCVVCVRRIVSST